MLEISNLKRKLFIEYLKEFRPWFIPFLTESLIMVRMKCSVGLALIQRLVFKIIHKTCFAIWQKISRPADLEIYYFNLELAI